MDALEPLARQLEAAPRASGRGKIIAVLGAQDDAPRAAVARAFARRVALQAQRAIWLIDLDVPDCPHAQALTSVGPLSAPFDLTLGVRAFWRVDGAPAEPGEGAPPDPGDPGRRVMTLRQVGASALHVSQFHPRALPAGARASLRDAPDYWRTARRAADVVVVDAPSTRRSGAWSHIAPFADACILVTDATPDGLEATAALREALEAARARVAGVVLIDDALAAQAGLERRPDAPSRFGFKSGGPKSGGGR